MKPEVKISTKDKIEMGLFENKLPYPLIAGSKQSKQEITEARQAYRSEDVRIHNEFRKSLEEEFGMVGHPKANKLFEIAWREGHSEGYQSIVYWYEELYELVK